MNRLQHALLTAAATFLPVAAEAQPVSGLYIAGGGGVNWTQRSDLEPTNGAARAQFGSGSIGFETGYGFVGSLGYGFGNGLRAEIEGNYRNNDVDSGRMGFIAPPRRTSGHVLQYGVMANVFYDFAVPNWPVQPYVGLGAGYGWVNYQNVRVQSASGPRLDIFGTSGDFAYQAIGGVSFPIRAVPGLALTAEYRFYGTLDQEVPSNYVPAANTVVRRRTDVENLNHSIMVGLRYAFNQPRPAPAPIAAPMPAAAPAPARTYLVFFDFDRADLTDRARQIIAEAAQAVSSTGTTRIEVAGHADRSGTPQYNQRLSMRRAEAVAAELTRRGVPRSAMSIQAFGESRPLVPTADGVREPQNRRVEIVLR
ncbi:OmpA family protein [Pararoseomonas indoligenes]|uniref:OmpA family protein n=1 Tax=Roseomonas indoligenes TaxID=2820811 RepID=A0A940MY07_9PROT|nr:OmpA family protein [Pararoseomonas indoligenes]MBP0493095.1 OmpA family protein [Pararoseomonas indoligenes]